MWQITAPHFCAAIVFERDSGHAIEAAPIIYYMVKGKWTRHGVWDYCRRKGWSIAYICP